MHVRITLFVVLGGIVDTSNLSELRIHDILQKETKNIKQSEKLSKIFMWYFVVDIVNMIHWSMITEKYWYNPIFIAFSYDLGIGFRVLLLFLESFLVFFRSLHVWDAFGDYGACWSKTHNLSCRSSSQTKIPVGVERHHPWCRATPIPDGNSKTQLIDVLKIFKFGPELSLISKESPSRF